MVDHRALSNTDPTDDLSPSKQHHVLQGTRALALLMTSLLLLLAPAARGATESGYFLISSDAGQVDQFPLLMTEVDAEISGFLARVQVRQVYRNDGEVPLEAKYVLSIGR